MMALIMYSNRLLRKVSKIPERIDNNSFENVWPLSNGRMFATDHDSIMIWDNEFEKTNSLTKKQLKK